MKSKSITVLLPLLLMMAVSLIMPDVGEAAMWIGLQGGPNFVANGDVKADFSNDLKRLKEVKTQPAFLGGVIIGYDFVKEGFLGYDYPKWMKYFSVAIDLTYNDFSQKAQEVRAEYMPVNQPRGLFPLQISKVDGYMLELSLLFIAKYGFFPDPDIPFGRLIPYVGVGPGLVFSVAKTPAAYAGYPSSDSNELAIFTEAGLRYMVLRNMSIDAAFRYRYVFPSYDVSYDETNIGKFHIVGRIIAQSFDTIFRVNYHF